MINVNKFSNTAFLLFVCLFCHIAHAAPPHLDNMTLLEKNTREAAEKITDGILSGKDAAIKFRRILIDSSATRALVNKEVRSVFSAKNLLSTDTSADTIRISVNENAVLYDRPESMSGDSVVRTIKTSLFYSYNAKGNLQEESVEVLFRDSVSVDEILLLERGGNPIAKGILPKTKTTFWKRVLTPAIVVGAAVLSVVLLFSVRSK